MKKLIKSVDPSLKFKGSFGKSMAHTYKVERAGRLYVLKLADKREKSQIEHLERERKVLSLAQGIQGITNLIKVYQNPTDQYSLEY